MSSEKTLQTQYEKEIEDHNRLANQIQAGEQQLAAMKEDKQRRFGRIELIGEQLKGMAKSEEPVATQDNE